MVPTFLADLRVCFYVGDLLLFFGFEFIYVADLLLFFGFGFIYKIMTTYRIPSSIELSKLKFKQLKLSVKKVRNFAHFYSFHCRWIRIQLVKTLVYFFFGIETKYKVVHNVFDYCVRLAGAAPLRGAGVAGAPGGGSGEGSNPGLGQCSPQAGAWLL